MVHIAPLLRRHSYEPNQLVSRAMFLCRSLKKTKNAQETHLGITERFSLTLKEPLGRGAIGIVHPAIVEVTLQSGEIVKHNLVLKLAFTAEQQEGLENEYRIYNYLFRKKGVKGIPTVHGVFRDPELDVLAMLMNDAGQSLRSREAAKGKEGRKVSEKERCVCMSSHPVFVVSVTHTEKHLLKRCKVSTKLVSGTMTLGRKIC